jgi:NtrC-family two-component system response regulator AlgB
LSTILVLGNDPESVSRLAERLSRAGHRVIESSSPAAARAGAPAAEGLVVVGFRPPAPEIQPLIDLLRARNPALPAIMVVDDAVSPREVFAALGDRECDVLPASRAFQEFDRALLPLLQHTRDAPSGAGHFFVAGETTRKLAEFCRQVASSDATVLLRGETGTGKGLIARHIHTIGRRSARPFLEVPCITLTDHLLGDSTTLDGHPWTETDGMKPAGIDRVRGGTVFFDEVGELSPTLQGKLLCLLTERATRHAESARLLYDVRVIAATNLNLEEMTQSGRFRSDLFYRLNVVEMALPPLRERPDEIIPFARHFAAASATASNRPAPEFHKDVEAALLAHSWPGNLRELRNVIERAMILKRGDTLGLEDFPERIARRGAPATGALSLEEIEKRHIEAAVRRSRTFEEAAQTLGINVATLWRKRRRYGLR